MKNNIYFFLLFFPLSFLSCNSEPQPENTQPETVEIEKPKPVSSVPKSLIKSHGEDGVSLPKKLVDSLHYIQEIFKEGDKDKIAELFRYPIPMGKPLPSIKDKKEFKRRFYEVLDEKFIDEIANSDKEDWRGYFHSIDTNYFYGLTYYPALDKNITFEGSKTTSDEVDDESGIYIIEKLRVSSRNYDTDLGEKRYAEFLEKERNNLHPSLRTYESPLYRIETDNYFVRVDILSRSNNSIVYRYASWKKGMPESSKPDLILNNGDIDFEYEGGGGSSNLYLIFTNGEYIYRVLRNYVGAVDTPPVEVLVWKGEEKILEEAGIVLE